tara:strand:- start:152 stop:610 length:459 start_codon:yes stop_codon:yes gene_type:complete
MKNVKSTTQIPVVNKWGDRKVLRTKVVRIQRHGEIWHCGYVTLSADHPLTGLYISQDNGSWRRDSYCIDQFVEVHGGITYHVIDDEGNLCLGFDCDHYGDDESGINKDASYAIKETESLASQLTDPNIIESAMQNGISDLESQLEYLKSISK